MLPIFTQFKVANERLNKSAFIKSIRFQITDEELKNKCKLLRHLEKEKIKLFNGPLFDLSHVDEFVMKTIFWTKVRPLVNRLKRTHNKKTRKIRRKHICTKFVVQICKQIKKSYR